MSTLSAHELMFGYGPRQVLDRVSCALDPGWTAIVGPNGAGKSTLLRLLAGLLRPQQGTARLDGEAVLALAARERARRIAWLAQQGEATGELDARETVQLGRLAHHGLFAAPTAVDDAAVDAAMQATECSAWQYRRLGELSGGERQRVLLARVLATEARVLLLDEPTTHLDPPHQVAVARLMRRLASTHTVVSVLHDLPLALLADRVLILRDGRMCWQGRSDDPSTHAALVDAFDGAIRIEQFGGRAQVVPDVSGPA